MITGRDAVGAERAPLAGAARPQVLWAVRGVTEASAVGGRPSGAPPALAHVLTSFASELNGRRWPQRFAEELGLRAEHVEELRSHGILYEFTGELWG